MVPLRFASMKTGRQDDVVGRFFLKHPFFAPILGLFLFQNETEMVFFGVGTAFANVSA